jgi:hypothetical protein
MSDQFGLVGISNDDIKDLLFARDGTTTFNYGSIADNVVGALCDSHIDIKRTLGLKRCEIDYNLKRTTFDNEYPGGEGAPFFGTPGAINVAETDYPTNRVYAEDEFELVNLCFKSIVSPSTDPSSNPVGRIGCSDASCGGPCCSWATPAGTHHSPVIYPQAQYSNASQRMLLGFPGNNFAIDVDDQFDSSMIRTRTYGTARTIAVHTHYLRRQPFQ